MKDTLLHCTGSLSLLFCWFVWSFIPKSSFTCLDELPGHNEGFPQWQLVRNGRVKIYYSWHDFRKSFLQRLSRSVRKSQKGHQSCGHVQAGVLLSLTAVALLFLRLKSLTGEQGMHVSFYTVLWGFHSPVWPCSSAFIMSLRHNNPCLLFCLHNFSSDSSVSCSFT